jgi:ferredoxin
MAWNAPRPATPARDRGPAASPGFTLAVDRIACDGYGTCADLLPELITLDEWGYPILRPGPVPGHLLGHARMAVDTCPVLALRLAAVERATIRSVGSDAPAGAGAGVTWAPAGPRDR